MEATEQTPTGGEGTAPAPAAQESDTNAGTLLRLPKATRVSSRPSRRKAATVRLAKPVLKVRQKAKRVPRKRRAKARSRAPPRSTRTSRCLKVPSSMQKSARPSKA